MIILAIGLGVALMGLFFERLPQGMLWFQYFRKPEDVSAQLLCRTKVWMVASGAVSALVAAVGIWLGIYWLQFFAPLTVILVCMVALYYLWLQGAPKSLRWIVWPALVVTLGLVGYMMVQGEAQTEVELGDKSLEIQGMYSLTLPYDQIVRVELLDRAPRTTLRTDGFSANGIRKGYFKLENGDRCYLNTDDQIDAYIYIYKSDGDLVVFNTIDVRQTDRVFEQLKRVN